jgi:hypothetical protein
VREKTAAINSFLYTTHDSLQKKKGYNCKYFFKHEIYFLKHAFLFYVLYMYISINVEYWEVLSGIFFYNLQAVWSSESRVQSV